MTTHALFHFPLYDGDGVPQALRVVSGAGVPGYHQDGTGIWGLTWSGQPQELTERESWIAIWAERHVYGWVRFCHAEEDSSSIGDPTRGREGVLLLVDRYLRFAAPVSFHPNSRRSRYLDDAEALQLNVASPNAGEAIAWVDASHRLRQGCALHP